MRFEGKFRYAALAVLMSAVGISTVSAEDDGALAALQAQVKALQAQVTSQQAAIKALQTQNAQLAGQIATVLGNTVLSLNGKLGLLPDNTTALFSGVNVQVVNGLGGTETTNGAGNLIVGYNETNPANIYSNPPGTICTLGTYQDQTSCLTAGYTWAPSQRSGSHNLVIGSGHSYTQYGGLVAGQLSVINSPYASVSGGYLNHAYGTFSTVTGGTNNYASALFSSATGGVSNVASGQFSSVSGSGNTASGESSSVSGGYFNTANALYSTVSGGYNNTASNELSSVSGGDSNTASGVWSSVSGGFGVMQSATYGWAGGTIHSP